MCVTHTQKSFPIPTTYRCNNVASIESDVLHAGTAVVLDVLLNLRALFARRGLVNRHLHSLFPIRHDNGP